MARGTAVTSSLPPQPEPGEEEIDLMAPQDGDEEDDGEFEENPESDLDQDDAAELNFASVEAMQAQARAEGWRPLAEFGGRPGTWKTAGAFIRDGRNFLPFVKKQLRESQEHGQRVTTELEGLRTELAQTREDMQQLLGFSRRASKVAYDKAIRDLTDKQRQAVAEGDVSTFDQASEQIAQMDQAREESGVDEPPAHQPAPRPQPNPRVAINPAIMQWVEENPWYNKDRALNAAMVAEHIDIMEKHPGMSVADQLARAKEAVIARHPEKFGLERPPAPQSRQTPRRPAAPLSPKQRIPEQPANGAALTFENAIPDPRERAQAQGAYRRLKTSMPDYTVQEYLEAYLDPHAEVDYTQRNKK